MSDTPMYITGPKCGKQIRVRMEGDTFFLAEACQNNCAEGTGVVALMESCKVCPADHPIQIVVRDKDGTERPAGATVAKQQVEPSAPEVAPAPPMLPKGSEINIPTPPPVQAAPQSLPEAPPVQAAPQAPPPQMDIMAAFQAATQLAAAEPVTLVAEATPEIPVGLPPIREEESESGTVSEAQFLPMDLAPKMDPVDLAPAPAPGTDGNPLLVPAPREAQPALSSADLSIQGVQLVPVSPEDRVDVETAIASIPGYKGGPSAGGLSSHDLLDFQQCHRRSFFNRRLGLGSVTEKRHFKVGSLYHACMAMRYGVQSDLTFAPCDAVAAAGAPEMARSVRALIEMQLRIYAQQEWETWCPLAVEECYVYHLPKQKINDVSGVQIPISWRPDLILGIKRAEDPHPVAGHRHDGPVFIVDWKCVAEGERLWTKYGVIEAQVTKDDINGLLSAHVRSDGGITGGEYTAKFNDNGIKPTVIVRTSSGREVTVTENHPFWTDTGWKTAGTLEPQDWVACFPLTSVEGRDEYPNEKIELLGYLLGDGTFRDRDTVAFFSTDTALMERFDALARVSGTTGSITELAPRKEGYLPSSRWSAGWKSDLGTWIEEFGLRSLASWNKAIPRQIMSCTKEQVAILLAALWSTDGHVSLYGGKTIRVSYSTTSEFLARDVQQLLWRLGIWSTRHSFPHKFSKRDGSTGWTDQWVVTVAGVCAKEKFLSALGSRILGAGKERLHDIRRSLSTTIRGRGKPTARIPVSLFSAVMGDNALNKVGKYYVSALTGKGKEGISHWLISQEITEYPYPHPLQAAVDSPAMWDTVEEVLDGPTVRTIAVEVPTNPVFLTGDGLITHNTTGYITPDLTDGFAMDFQFKTYQSLYHRMGFEERYGRLAGVMVCIAEKQDGKSAPNPDSFFRQTAPTSKAELDEFFEDELMPLATEYYSLLQDQDKTLNHRAWSRSTSNCITRWGKCDYHVICNGGRIDDRIHFKVNPHRIIDISTFAGAPSGKAVTEAAASAKAKADPDAELKKQAKKDIKEELKVKCTELYASWLLSWMEIQPEVYASILKENFITPDAKFDGVVKALTDALQSLYSAFARDKVVNPIGDYTWSYRPSSIGVCPTGQKSKATVTYKQLATAICKLDWFNMSKVMAG